MRKGWETKKLSEIAQHSLGKMLDKTKNKGEPKPYLRNFNVRWFDFDLSDVLEMPFLPEEASKYTAVKGDLLVCEGGYPGRAAIWTDDEPIYFQKALHRVRFNEPERNKWFLYYLHARDLDGTLKKHFNGAGIQHFTGEALAQFELPIPPLSEQQRIVGILDKAFAGLATAKANAEKNLQNARAVFDSHVESVFTHHGREWKLRPFEDCIEDVKYTTKIKRTDFLEEGNFPIVSQESEFTNGWWDDDADLFRATSPVVIFGDHTKVLKYIDFDFVLGADGVKILQPKPILSPKFFFYLLKSVRLKSLGYSRHYRLLKELSLRFPGREEQTAIAIKLDALSTETQRLESLYQRKLAALEALKKSLLHQAFTGAL